MIIGSSALRYHYPNQRYPKDLDVIGTYSPFFDRNLPVDHFDRPVDILWDDRLTRYRPVAWWDGAGYAFRDELYTIKISHSYWELNNGSWWKHIRDIRFLKDKGAVLIQPLHDILYEIWTDKHGPKKMKFMSKDDFFKDAVTRKYDHDSLHESVAYGDTAMYHRTLVDPSSTKVDMAYVKGMEHDDQIRLYREEVCATALERIVIPRDYRCSPGAAYLWALRRTITSLTRGWSATFILDHYSEFATPCDYVTRHLANKDKLIQL